MEKYYVIVNEYGTTTWFKDAKCTIAHRVGGPAMTAKDGNQWWYFNGKCHRLDGPAIEYANGRKAWYINGVELTEAQFNACVDRTVNMNGVQHMPITIDGINYKLVPV